MRKKIDTLNKTQIEKNLPLYRYAQWFKLQPNNVTGSIEERMQPPAGYSEMPRLEQKAKRDAARAFFRRLNQKLIKQEKPTITFPAWCQPVQEKTCTKPLRELLECPGNYPSMTAEEQAAIRAKRCTAIDQYNARRSQEGKPPVDYADWMKANDADS